MSCIDGDHLQLGHGWCPWLSSVSLSVHNSSLPLLSGLQSLACYLCFKSIPGVTEPVGNGGSVELGEC